MQVHPGIHIPLNAVLVSLVITLLVPLINLGSTVALNAFNSVVISALMSSYMLTIGCVLYRRLTHQPLPSRRWSLGRWGIVVNIASLAFLTPLFIFAFFPLATPVDAASMNYGVVMFGAVMVGATIYYWFLGGREQYTPPVVLLKRDQYEM
jgi:amino acid transporter